jgi:hypothetical protein
MRFIPSITDSFRVGFYFGRKPGEYNMLKSLGYLGYRVNTISMNSEGVHIPLATFERQRAFTLGMTSGRAVAFLTRLVMRCFTR